MCGVAGILRSGPKAVDRLEDALETMLATIAHRGPDDAGMWTDPEVGVAIGNRRLAIVDPSPAGHQPMVSASGRYVVVHNGEIYNHLDLRARLDAAGRSAGWAGHSDTETLVAAIEAWGVATTLPRLSGMFAFAVWDRDRRRLHLARDALGQKPLHFGRVGGAWLFGSELKAIVALLDATPAVDRTAFAQYMALGYVPAPLTIHEGIRKVEPGCFVTIDPLDATAQTQRYWSARAVASQARLAFASDEQAVDAMHDLLLAAVRRHLLSDRPVGAFLSGGVDSSTLVALMRTVGVKRVESFSIGFDESSHNEAAHASRIARHLGTRHTELYVKPGDVLETVPRLARMYDEPFADPSQIPTHLVARLASASIAVSLAGDGGDELFGGYPRYRMAERLWSIFDRLPARTRGPLGRVLQHAPLGFVDRGFASLFPHDDAAGTRGLRPIQKLGKLGRALRGADTEALYWNLLAPWGEPSLLRKDVACGAFPSVDLPEGDSLAENFMLRDLVGYLPDDMLTKVDRATMAASLESRAPLLDAGVVEFALRLPRRYKLRGPTDKWILRQVLHRYVPPELLVGVKVGFGVPLAAWLRGPLKDWARDQIASAHGPAADLIDVRAVSRLMDRHLQGLGDWHQPLWTALMALSWSSMTARADHETDGAASTRPRATRAPTT